MRFIQIFIIIFCLISSSYADSLIGIGTIQGEEYFSGTLSFYPEVQLFDEANIGWQMKWYSKEENSYVSKAVLHHLDWQTQGWHLNVRGLEQITIGKGLLVENYRTYYYGQYFDENNLGVNFAAEFNPFYLKYFSNFNNFFGTEGGLRLQSEKIEFEAGYAVVENEKINEPAYQIPHLSLRLFNFAETYTETVQQDNAEMGTLTGLRLGNDEINIYYEKIEFENYFIPKKYNSYFELYPELYTTSNNLSAEDTVYEYGLNLNQNFMAIKLYKIEGIYESWGMHLVFPVSKWLYVEYQYLKPALNLKEEIAEDFDAQFMRTILMPAKNVQVLFELSRVRAAEDYWYGLVEYIIKI